MLADASWRSHFKPKKRMGGRASCARTVCTDVARQEAAETEEGAVKCGMLSPMSGGSPVGRQTGVPGL